MNDRVNIDAPRRRYGPLAVLATVALAALVLIVAISLPRDGREAGATASPAPSGSVAASATPSVSPSASASSSTVASATSGPSAVTADSRHGIITFESIRTEGDPMNLQQPPQFSRSGTSTFNVAVSPDGKRIAIVRGGQTGQQLITFTAARPNDVTTVVDFSGSGEVVTHIVWSGDGSNSVLLSVEKQSRGQGGGDNLIVEYSVLRSVDLSTLAAQEVARIAGQNNSLYPLAWLPARQLAAALEVRPLGPVANYMLVRGSSLERTNLNTGASIASFTASRDGARIVGVFAPAVRWWPVDQPAAVKELLAQSDGRAEYAAFRPGADELAVRVAAASTSPGVPPPGHFEIWSLSGQQRVVSATVGFSRWRVDGTAAIDGSTLVNPATGATTPLLGGAFKIVDTVLF